MYQQKLRSHNTWLDAKKVKTFETGEKIEVFDKNGVWRKAKIIKKSKKGKKQTEILVSFDKMSSNFNEFIGINSVRIVSDGFVSGFMRVLIRFG